MPPESSRWDNENRGRQFRVILIGGEEIGSSFQDSSFTLHRCEGVDEVADYWDGETPTVLLVDLGQISEAERLRLRKQMAQFSALVLAMTDAIDDTLCESLLRMGCVGALRRGETSATIARAIRAVVARELWFPRATLSRFLRGFLAAQDPDRLTSRELEILELVDLDLNNQQIGDKLFISRETVRWHIKSLHSKLGIRTRRGLREHIRLLHRLGKAIPPKRIAENELESRVAG